jgi:predicted nucleic acid-binding protein
MGHSKGMEVQPRGIARTPMIGSLAFFDTNIFVYADDPSAPEKQERAITLIADHLRKRTAVISIQVLQEYFAAATRKLGIPAAIRSAPDLDQSF